MERVFIFGAGGLGSVAFDVLHQTGRYEPVAFFDNDIEKHGRAVDGLLVRGALSELLALARRERAGVLVAVGDNADRVVIAEQVRGAGLRLVSAIHPSAAISPSAILDEHVLLGPRATICVHARIGAHAVISAGAIVEHDVGIGAGAFLHPAVRLAGGVTIGPGATLGIGAAVIPGRRIGRGAVVAPGAVVIRDVPEHGNCAGVPGRITCGASASAARATASIALAR
ncbi:MAG: acetyltransferase [Phycisphaerae bacterium]